ncbi:MAG: transposase [Phycisphaerales bacterium]|nr:transposase [Phycisphaerales bacterium]
MKHRFRICGRCARLDRNDTLIVWRRPKNRIRHLSPEQWAVLPESMHVRRVETTVAAYGFRTQHIQVLTTLLDEAAYSGESIAALYRDRWMAELNLRSLKTTLNMEVLRESRQISFARKCTCTPWPTT